MEAKQAKFGEPWRAANLGENKTVVNIDWKYVATECRPDAQARIVACVNACEGIPDPSAVGELVEALKSASDLYFTDPDTVDSEDRLAKDTGQAIDDLMVMVAALSKATPADAGWE